MMKKYDYKYNLIAKEVSKTDDYILEHITATMVEENKTNIQNINIITKINEDVLVTGWSSFKDKEFHKLSVIEMAKDFEKNNIDYEVVMATNSDYFNYEGQSINCNIIFGNRVIKSDNHIKYSSLEINQLGEIIKHHKKTIVSPNKIVRINNKIYDFNLIKENLDTIDTNNNTYYEIEINKINEIGSHFFLEGKLQSKTIRFSKPYLLEVPSSFTNALDLEGQTIKIQYEVEDFGDSNMMVGIDTILIQDNKRLTLEEITGQNFEHNTEVHPRTGFGYDINGNFKIITVDGRLSTSVGVNLLELSKIMQENGFVEGYNFDGGGSTQLVIKIDNELTTINQPSEYPLRPVGNIILFIKKKAE